jgi:hypothetical protein
MRCLFRPQLGLSEPNSGLVVRRRDNPLDLAVRFRERKLFRHAPRGCDASVLCVGD